MPALVWNLANSVADKVVLKVDLMVWKVFGILCEHTSIIREENMPDNYIIM